MDAAGFLEQKRNPFDHKFVDCTADTYKLNLDMDADFQQGKKRLLLIYMKLYVDTVRISWEQTFQSHCIGRLTTTDTTTIL